MSVCFRLLCRFHFGRYLLELFSVISFSTNYVLSVSGWDSPLIPEVLLIIYPVNSVYRSVYFYAHRCIPSFRVSFCPTEKYRKRILSYKHGHSQLFVSVIVSR